ncbi:MAG: hypothetical protein JO112_23655, partial [Planctomycetes bacterium]|nr:hypothetical protein [Planctomycetota bacterium]
IQFGINSTILCPTPLGSPPSSYRLFGGTLTGGNPPKANPPSHPYLQDELLTKIASSVTTRSHVFVLWLTVGFFQVTNDTSYPVQLGQEIGASTGQNVRHHMFAIVDRSALTVPNNNNGTLSQAAVTITGVNTIKVGALQDSANPPQWWIKPGTILTVDNAGSSQETLVVTATNTANNTITAKFNKTHATGVPIMIPDPGNPGPQPQFLPQDNSAVVPYYAVID